MKRIPALDPADFTEEQKNLVGEWTYLEFSRVLINSPRMYGTFVPWLKELIAETVLSARDRQIVCLRMLELCGDVYEKTHHIVISRKCGLSDEEIEAFRTGEGAALADADRYVVSAVEELYKDQCIGDATWEALARRYSQEQLMELVFLAGCYQTMGMLTKSFGIKLEEDLESFNELRDYAEEA